MLAVIESAKFPKQRPRAAKGKVRVSGPDFHSL